VRRAIALVAGLLILAAANWTIVARERLLAEGSVVLLELAPVDPRSLMQGDYMALRFALADELERKARVTRDGRVVVRLDERGVGRYARVDDGGALGDREMALRYRLRDGRVKFATNAFFFQEGTAAQYAGGRYGEARVAPSGELLITALRGANLEPLGAPRR
jgi:uncharacterized membrane-anchored protein